ncbi:transposase [Planctomycetota bacterium]
MEYSGGSVGFSRRLFATSLSWWKRGGGTATHIHLAIHIEPHVTISQLIRDLKGGSSHDLNSQLGSKELYWQRGYAVVSFGKNNLDWVLQYVAGQKEHHKNGFAQDRLERVTADEEEQDV